MRVVHDEVGRKALISGISIFKATQANTHPRMIAQDAKRIPSHHYPVAHRGLGRPRNLKDCCQVGRDLAAVQPEEQPGPYCPQGQNRGQAKPALAPEAHQKDAAKDQELGKQRHQAAAGAGKQQGGDRHQNRESQEHARGIMLPTRDRQAHSETALIVVHVGPEGPTVGLNGPENPSVA